MTSLRNDLPESLAAPTRSVPDQLPPAYPERAAWGTANKLRAWQTEALDAYFSAPQKDFLVAATPGAGKTTFALWLASEMRRQRLIDRITVVTPTEHLKTQWADAASRIGIRLDPTFRNAQRRYADSYRGAVVTYAQIALNPAVHRDITDSASTLVILDEVHHAGDALSWGDAIREAFGGATRRLALTGTPFRSDAAPIPFVTYLPDADGVRTSVTDFNYGYRRALTDGVVRPVLFLVYAGHMRWRTRAGDEMEARLGEDNTKDITSAAWRTALDPGGEWIPAVLSAADRRLSQVRAQVPDAGGLVIATDRAAARAYASILARISGEEPTVVLSDEKEASDRIAQFSTSSRRWMVAVRMVSEGVDVPRLAVGVYATSASTPLFFAQAVGRFVRARRRGETASIFVPNVPVLMNLAAQLEVERDHALDRREPDAEGLDDDLLAEAQRNESASDDQTYEFTFEALGADAEFDRVLYDGDEFGSYAEPGSDEELDFIGIPGLLEPDQVHELLRQRQARQSRRAAQHPGGRPETDEPLHRTLKEQRQLLHSLVGLYAKMTDQPHGSVHTELRRVCGGPSVAQASTTQLQSRIRLLRKRLGTIA